MPSRRTVSPSLAVVAAAGLLAVGAGCSSIGDEEASDTSTTGAETDTSTTEGQTDTSTTEVQTDGAGQKGPDATEDPAEDLDVFALGVGDCLDVPSVLSDAAEADEDVEVETVAARSCDEPHDAEVYAAFDLDLGDTYPGVEVVSQQAGEECSGQRWEDFMGSVYRDDPTYDVFTLYPTQQTFDRIDDREVICIVYRIDEQKVTGTLEGLGES